jgi:hypothetical protein
MDILRATIETADFGRLRRSCYSLSKQTPQDLKAA